MIATVAFLLAAFAAGPPGELAPVTVLSQYRAALAAVTEPRVFTFEYTVTQVGPQTLYQTHRVYRSGLQARDETVEVAGHQLSEPSVRVSASRPFRYAVSLIAPTASDYSFEFSRAVVSGRHWTYDFATVPLHPGNDFVVTSVTIDGLTSLPLKLTFRTATGTVSAQGSVTYARVDHYWMPQEAVVEAPIAGTNAAERITFHAYQFPESLPPSTFRD